MQRNAMHIFVAHTHQLQLNDSAELQAVAGPRLGGTPFVQTDIRTETLCPALLAIHGGVGAASLPLYKKCLAIFTKK